MFFQFDLKKVFIGLAILSLPFVLTNLEGSLKALGAPFVGTAHVFQSGLNWISSGVQSTASEYVNLISVKNTNRTLLKEVSRLRMEKVAYEEVKLENERLRNMLSFKEKSSIALRPALVVSQDAISDSNSLTINRGSKHFIKRNMGVLGLEGVTGFINETSKNSSEVIMITDRFAAIEGLVQRSRAKGIVEGNGGDLLEMRHIDQDIDIQIGDLVVTSGESNMFPKGLPIGIVEEIVEDSAGIIKTAFVRPRSVLNDSEELFVVIKTNNENLNPDSSSSTSLLKNINKKVRGDR